MKMFDHINKSVAAALLLCLLGMAAGSCVREDYGAAGPDASLKYVKIKLTLPAIKEPAKGTRAMSVEDENMIDQGRLHILMVKESNDAISQVPLVGGVVYDEADRSKATITVRLPKGENGNDRIRLCIVANHDITMQPTYEQFRLSQQFAVDDKWPVDESFPMWGESDGFVVTDATAAQDVDVDMYRALARIDVGLDFIFGDGKFTEAVNGLPDFKINSVSVYNTRTKAMVAPASMPPTVPNVPFVSIRPWDDPLIYGGLGGVDSYVREIYVPESSVPADPFGANRNIMHCVIVGGFYNGSATETFYRLEFATDDGNGNITTLPILRNHRYVFNIKGISEAGYPTREMAFGQEGAIADRQISYDLVVLDENIHHIELEGGYYFGLDDRDIIFEPQQGNGAVVRYQTNLPESTALMFEWTDQTTGEARYGITVDPVTKSFTITTLTENISGKDYIDTLYVKSGTFSIPVIVRQRCVNLNYSIVCSSVVVNGIYTIGEALNATHYIDLSIMAEDISIAGKTYIIETEDPEGGHGISFRATGIFDFGPAVAGDPLVMNIRLYANGMIPQSVARMPFKLRIKTNSGSGNFCEATIVPVEPRMNIVVMSVNTNAHGYAIDRLNGGAGKVFNNTNNFGPYDHSIVKTAGFNYINDNTYYDFALYPSSNMYKWVTGRGNNGKIADMVYIAYTGYFNNATAILLAEYLQNGGVIVIFLEEPSYVQNLMRSVFGSTDINASRPANLGAGSLYPMPANPILVPDPVQRDQIMRQFENDPILTGPFGDIREEQIGEDLTLAVTITNLPTTGAYADLVTVYSYGNNINANPPIVNSTSVLGFKLEDDDGSNIFYWGDGGLMSSPTTGNPAVNIYTYLPFNWDTGTGFPIPMPSFGTNAGYRKPAYNSTMFCNVMAWAINKSQEVKARRQEYERTHPD